MITISVSQPLQVWLIAIAVFAIPAWAFTILTIVLMRAARQGRRESRK